MIYLIIFRKNGIKYTDFFILYLERLWFMKTQFIEQSKHHVIQSKYCEKIWKFVSEKQFNDEIAIGYLKKLLKKNQYKLIEDIENLKKKNSFFIKIQDFSQSEIDFSVCIHIKKTKMEKLKLCLRIKKNGFTQFGDELKEIIELIKREISIEF